MNHRRQFERQILVSRHFSKEIVDESALSADLLGITLYALTDVPVFIYRALVISQYTTFDIQNK